jgi:putative FmdB family regulatory protein
MPLYEYRCEKCGKRFEKLRRMQDADQGVECPECESEEVERLLSSFATGGCGAGAGSRFT